MSRIWDDVIPEEERMIYQEAGFRGAKVGMGQKPALLIIDVQYRTAGEDKPILESIRESDYKTGCGEFAWGAIRKIQRLLEVVRIKGIPVIYPVVERQDRFDAGRWADKIPTLGSESIHRIGSRGTEIIREIAPLQGDLIISKRYASAFFGTHLMTHLNILGIDTLMVTGCTTSGCVRATVADGFSYGFRVIVVEDGVYDRSSTSHKVNLFDMHSKYADVLALSEVIELLKKF